MALQPVFYDPQYGFRTDDGIIQDPGDASAIPVQTGTCALTSVAAETRTLAIPEFAGQEITLLAAAIAGQIDITVASAFTYVGDTIITMNSVGESVTLRSVYTGSAFRWQLLFNDLNGANTDTGNGLT
jgi:hypothetical protein